eukprot:NODE_1112_length_2158_cov_0.441962.p3 type:complete len:115 gc:universal NODE_1112_length_2158_cov_0.441962:1750-1406(-)
MILMPLYYAIYDYTVIQSPRQQYTIQFFTFIADTGPKIVKNGQIVTKSIQFYSHYEHPLIQMIVKYRIIEEYLKLKNEITVLSKLNHQNIIKLIKFHLPPLNSELKHCKMHQFH